MRKVYKFILWPLLTVVALLIISYFLVNESPPTGEEGPAAEVLADKMMQAISRQAWDSTRIIQWTFRGKHDLLWDKHRNYVQVVWDGNKVLLDTKKVAGRAYQQEKEVTGPGGDKLVYQAWSIFCNDSWWLNPMVKVKDPGTVRRIVRRSDGSESLLVTFTEGGVTPGDSYLWNLGSKNQPVTYQLWVKIIPIGGIAFTFEDWDSLPEGAMIAKTYKSWLGDVRLSNIRAARTFEKLGIPSDPFEPIYY